MLTETGRVVAIDSDFLWVETSNTSACGSCSAQRGCGQSLLARWAAKNTYLKVPLDGRKPDSFQLNDNIDIGVPEDVVVKSSLMIYCLPLVTMLVGAAVGDYGTGNEVVSIVGAAMGLAGGGLAVKLYSRLKWRDRRLQPVILDRLINSLAVDGQASARFSE